MNENDCDCRTNPEREVCTKSEREVSYSRCAFCKGASTHYDINDVPLCDVCGRLDGVYTRLDEQYEAL